MKLLCGSQGVGSKHVQTVSSTSFIRVSFWSECSRSFVPMWMMRVFGEVKFVVLTVFFA